LQGIEDQKKGSALEFMYVTVRDEYGDGALVHFSISTQVLGCI